MSESYIVGAKGGKGGGGSSRTPVEAPDTLKSRQFAKVLDLLGEGEIEGLVSGFESVYLDDTPIQNPDGSFNFSDVVLEFRTGTQEQDHINGYSGTEVETSVGLEIKSAVPLTKTITDPDIDELRLTLAVPRLTTQNISTGDINGATVKLKVEIQSNGGGYQDAYVNLLTSSSGIIYDKAPISANNDVLSVSVTDGVGLLGSIAWNRPKIGTKKVRNISTTTNSFPYVYSYQPAYKYISIFGGTPPKVRVEYRNITSGGAWIEISTNTFPVPNSNRISGSKVKLDVSNLFPADYEFRITKLSGTGSVALQGLIEETGQVTSTPVRDSKGNVETNKLTGQVKTTTAIGSLFTTVGEPIRYYKNGSITISGKTIKRYQRNTTVPLYGDPPWDIRITKLTPDSTKSTLVNNVFWDSYTSIISERLTYPNSAYAYLKVDSEQFSRVPNRGYHVRLLKVKIPSNYNPNTREYTGFWDGTFKVAWTNNPAWCYYDLITNERYGLGAFIEEALIDKWDLYNIGKYCDELVPDGFGGLEPRFTLNVYLQQREEAYNVIQSLTSVFRGMAYWTGGSLSTVQDSPSDPVATFTKANVIDGVFSYSGTSLKARHSVALITWNDPLNNYKPKVEYVENKDAVEKYGIREKEVLAVGCTSRGQANRVGRWLLYSEEHETETVVFKSGLEGYAIKPGEIIQVMDNDRAGSRHGGRILAGSSTTELLLDSPVFLESSKSYEISVTMPYPSKRVLPNGTEVESSLAAIEKSSFTVASSKEYAIVELEEELSISPKANAIWMLTETDLNSQKFRVLEVMEEASNIYKITGVEHNSSKFDFVDKDEELQTEAVSYIDEVPAQPENVEIEESLFISDAGEVKAKIEVSWDFVSNAVSYMIEYRFEEGNWETLTSGTKTSQVTLEDTKVGLYDLKITAIDSLKRQGIPYILEDFEAIGKSAPPENVNNFKAKEVNGGVLLTWDNVSDLDLEGYIVKVGTDWDSAITLADRLKSNSFVDEDPSAGSVFYLVRAIDTSGNLSELYTSVPVQLSEPGSVRRFIANQNKATVQLDWAALPAAELYEIRQGDSWESSSLVARTDTTYFNVSSGLSGSRFYWIKAISRAGIYSETASITTIDVVQLPDRNILATIDKENDNYTGRYINTVNISNSVQLEAEKSSGEFIFDIDTGVFVDSQSSYSFDLSVSQLDSLNWTDSVFSWASNSAQTRQWLPLGEVDIQTVSAELEIAVDQGNLSANYVDAIGLDNDENTYLGITPTENLNGSFSFRGRNGYGLDVIDVTQYSWGLAVPTVFSQIFWVNASIDLTSTAFIHDIATIYNTVTDDFLKLYYKSGILYLEGSDGNIVSITRNIPQDKLFAIGVSQASYERRLFVSDIFDTDNAEVSKLPYTPINSFNSVRLY